METWYQIRKHLGAKDTTRNYTIVKCYLNEFKADTEFIPHGRDELYRYLNLRDVKGKLDR